MRYRVLPESGIRVPVIGFGTGDNAGLMVAGDPIDQRAAVARALELGMTYFDTSPDYGMGRAEENLGRALENMDADAVICTKVEVTPDDLGDVAGAVVRSVEASLRRLRVDRVHVVQVHNAPDVQRVLHTPRWGALVLGDYLDPGGALDGMERLRADGKVDVFGFTCAHADPSAVRTLIETGRFGFVNVWYNALNPSAGGGVPAGLQVDRDYDGIIPFAAERGVGVAVFRPLAGGALTGQATGTSGRHSLAGGQITRNPAPFERELERARGLAHHLGCDGSELVSFAYRLAMDEPGVTTVLGGFSDIAQVEAVAAIADEPGLSEDERERLQRAWGSNFDVHQEVG